MALPDSSKGRRSEPAPKAAAASSSASTTSTPSLFSRTTYSPCVELVCSLLTRLSVRFFLVLETLRCAGKMAANAFWRLPNENLSTKTTTTDVTTSNRPCRRGGGGSRRGCCSSCCRPLLVVGVGLFLLSTVFVAIGLTRTVSSVSSFLRDERCLYRVPTVLQNAFVPPYNCSLCEALQGRVPSIQADEAVRYRHWISRKEVPLVVRGAYKRVASAAPISWAKLRTLYFGRGTTDSTGEDGSSEVPDDHDPNDPSDKMNSVIETSVNTCQFFAYNTEFTSLREALSMSDERMKRHFYIGWSNCEPAVSELLRRTYKVPDLLPDDSERSALEWLFVGNRGHGAHLHLDRLDKPSWQAQLSGVKRWTFRPLPECFRTCGELVVDLQPGDVIMLDSSVWYHKTEVISEELSIALGSEYD